MIIKQFRNEDFINRDKEINFFLKYFKTNPKRVTWVYGPKSTGKTTLIEYILENKLDNNEYNIKYLNFRRTLIGGFDSFIESFIEEKDEDETQTELNRNYNLFGLFKLEAKTLKKIKENRKNIFNYLMETFQQESQKRKNLFIIDEIQALQDIYINEDKKLLNEFLNFCIALTKETHLSHVLILTSNTLFLNEIYSNAKMKVTSDFKLIDHLPYNEIENWLITKYQFSISDSKLIYEYLGGSVAHIKKLIDFRGEYNSLEEQLEEMSEVTKNEIIFEKNNNLTNKEFALFLKIAKIIVEKEYFNFNENNETERRELKEIINRFCDVEIFFYNPITNKVTANSKIYIKAFELL